MTANPVWDEPGTIVVVCARGLAPFAGRETEQLGFAPRALAETAVTLDGSLRDCLRLNLWLRTGHRVLWRVGGGEAHGRDEFCDLARTMPWERWIDPDGYFTVKGSGQADGVRDTRLPALRLKDAVADRLRAACGRRPDSGRERHGAALTVHAEGNLFQFYLDTSGEPLSRRGYRLHPWKAPMQETLAAACVLALDWDGATPFVCPMAGSGTPAIEAAWIAARRAPGSLRPHFAFMALRGYREAAGGAASPADAWQELVERARQNERRADLPPIVATDHSAEAIEAARANATAAGCADAIGFAVCDFAATVLPPPPGTVFLNPEYGERLGDSRQLGVVYARIGDFLKRQCAGYRAGVLTGNAALARSISLHTERRLMLFNGPLPCRLLVFPAFPPRAP